MNGTTNGQRISLLGEKLNEGWTVIERVPRNPQGSTGSNFSQGYIVENHDARRGFLKAMDYADAMRSKNTPDELKRIVDAYTFERDLCLDCRHKKLTGVVHAITHGEHIKDPDAYMSEFSKVNYLIFELADHGDIRAYIDSKRGCGDVFKLKALHNIANALRQLHLHGIAHQDLKPSNIMVFRG